MQYKVWIEIEELTDEGEPTSDHPPILPDEIGVFNGLDEAIEFQGNLVRLYAPEHYATSDTNPDLYKQV